MRRKIDLLKIWPYAIYSNILFVFLSSRYAVNFFGIPSILSRLFTLCLYAPFIISIGYKVFNDLKTKKIGKLSFFFYLFLVYYVLVTIYRFFSGLEYKESIYYTLTFLGMIAFYIESKKSNNNINNKSILFLSLFVGIYQLIYLIFGHYFFEFNPININIIVGIYLVLFPVCLYIYQRKAFNNLFYIISTSMPILILIISESRSGFLLLIFELILSFIISIKRKKTKYILLPTLISIFVIALISGFNILMDSYTVSAMGIHEYSDIELMKNENKYEYNNHLKNEMNLIDSRVQNANNYINNLEDLDLSDSDRMRLDLMYLGVQQVKQNPLFGTGDLYYTYAVSETQIFEQTAHNIIIETLCCYGLIGFLQIFFILVMIIKNTIKSFKKSNQTILNSPICEIGIAIISYFTVSMVQPLGYDSLVFPILIITIIVMSQFLVKEERHVQQQK